MNTIQQLEQEIREASQAYYGSGKPIMSDDHFDGLVSRLRELDPDNELLKTPGTGFNPELVTHLRKYEHITTVGSLEKLKHQEVIEGRTEAFSDYFVASLKLDGGSAVAYYNEGVLHRVLTRGNGDIGLDITKNVLYGGTIPVIIKNKNIVAVRGEVLITQESFSQLGGKDPRNRANGLATSVHVGKDELKHLKFISYSILAKKKGSTVIDKISDLNALEEAGFLVVPWQLYNGWETFVDDAMNGDIDLSIPGVLENILRTEWRFARGSFRELIPVDGLVLTKLEYVLARDERYSIPVYPSIAYKFNDESATTKVLELDWTLTRTGRYVPVAVIEPVELEGAIIQRVTMNNMDFLQENMAGVGATIEIVRSNTVIPKIVGTHYPVQPDLPQYCPVCGIAFGKVGPDLACLNQACSHKQSSIITAILNYVLPDGLGQTTIDKIIEAFSLQDLAMLTDWIYIVNPERLYMFGDHYTELIMEMVEKVKNLKLTPGEVLQLANIPQVGKRVKEKIDANVTLEEFCQALRVRQPSSVWATYMNAPAFENLSKLWERIEAIVEFIGHDNLRKPLVVTDGKVKVTLTGALSMPRKQLVKLLGIEEVSIGKAEVLIADKPSNSEKYKKAIERNIPIMTEEEFRSQYIGE